MKRIIGLVFCFLLLCGCGNPAETTVTEATTEPIPITAAPDCRQASLYRDYVETEQGLLFLSMKDGTNGGLIWFIPKGESYAVPLCDKANCEHRNKDCNAWGGFLLTEYGGKLYTTLLEADYNLVAMDMDGSNHEPISAMPKHQFFDGSFGGSGQTVAAGNYLVFLMSADISRPYEEQLCHIYLFDLAAGKWHEAFTSLTEQYHFNPGVPYEADGKLYCMTDVQKPGGDEESWMLMLDPETEEWKLLFRMDPMFHMWAVYGDTLYYLIPDVGFREYNLVTGERVSKGLPVQDAVWASYGEDYIYLVGHNLAMEEWAAQALATGHAGTPPAGEEILYILNWEYELVDQVLLTDGEHPIFVTADRIYCTHDKANVNKPDTYIDKSQIGSGTLELLSLEP